MYRVVFPFELKLCNTSEGCGEADAVYNLFAVVVHIGSGMNHGMPFCCIAQASSSHQVHVLHCPLKRAMVVHSVEHVHLPVSRLSCFWTYDGHAVRWAYHESDIMGH